MIRSSIIRSITITYSVLAISSLMWAGLTWNSSNPHRILTVKGASSTLTDSPDQISLAHYPEGNFKDLDIQSKEYVLYHVETGKVLAQSKKMDPVPIASTTKLMTAYIVSLQPNLNEVVTVSKEGVSQIGSHMGLHIGEEMTVDNLLYGTLMVSGNDAAYTLAEWVGGKLLNNPQATSEDKISRFVEKMNTTAEQLKMLNTHYKDPAGLNDEGRSTAFDLAKLTSIIDSNPVLKKAIATATTTVYNQSGTYKYDLKNSNRLISEYDYLGSLGGKTGFTPNAGHCLINTAKRGDATLIAVILHTDADTSSASAIENRKLLDAGFTRLQWQ